MRENFNVCVEEVLRHEGGYVDHPKDPGGATNMGITLATLSSWRGKTVTKADVRALGKDEAIRIYRARYWNAVSADDLPAGLDMVAFDGCVNSGEDRAERWLQAAVGAMVDGEIGPRTIAAAKAADPARAINRALDYRLNFMKVAKDKKGNLLWPTFGKGWQKRIDRVRAFALNLAQARPLPEPEEAEWTAPTISIPRAQDRILQGGGIIALLVAALAGFLKMKGK